MSTLFPKPITVMRKAVGDFDDRGKFVPGVSSSIIVYGSVQPTTGKDTQAREVGRIDLGKVKCYMNEPLQVGTEGSGIIGDEIVYAGKVWEVIQDMPHLNDILTHHKYIAEYRREYTP